MIVRFGCLQFEQTFPSVPCPFSAEVDCRFINATVLLCELAMILQCLVSVHAHRSSFFLCVGKSA